VVGLVGWSGFALLPFTMAWLSVVAWKQVQHIRWAASDAVIAFRRGWLWRHLMVAPVVGVTIVAVAARNGWWLPVLATILLWILMKTWQEIHPESGPSSLSGGAKRSTRSGPTSTSSEPRRSDNKPRKSRTPSMNKR
jgi:hypothetical protein